MPQPVGGHFVFGGQARNLWRNEEETDADDEEDDDGHHHHHRLHDETRGHDEDTDGAGWTSNVCEASPSLRSPFRLVAGPKRRAACLMS